MTPMDRARLESLSRDDLMASAESLGVRRARIMTRPELIDEILLASYGKEDRERDKKKLERARGLFGRARDLLARVVEQGLHLPDAAERIRAVPLPTPPAARTPPSVLPTVTLAEIYASQGHTSRAVETLGKVLEDEPEHAAARALLERLESASYAPPPPPDLGPEEEPPPPEDAPEAGAAAEIAPPAVTAEAAVADAPADAAPEAAAASAAPTTGIATPVEVDVLDACRAIPDEAGALVVRWQVSRRMRDHHAARAGRGGLALRVVTVLATADGPRASVTDLPVTDAVGRLVLPRASDAAIRRVAVGWMASGAFVAIAHAEEIVRDRATGHFARWTPEGLQHVSAA